MTPATPAPGHGTEHDKVEADTVEAVYAGGDADAVAGTLGAHGATTVHSTGDLAGSLPGVPVASAIAKAVNDGNGPDLLMLGTTYDGRDIAARLSVAVDRPVITVRESDTLTSALLLFLREPIKRLVVVSDQDDGRPVGMLTPFDVIKVLSGQVTDLSV